VEWPVIWRNFVLAVWLSIAWAGYELAWLILHARAVDAFYAPFTPRYVFFPIVLGSAQLFLWWRVYRDRNRGARLAAGFAAAYFALQVIIMALQVSVRLPVRGADIAFFPYLAISHALFAFGSASPAL
jgi:hypothetical protein